ncbi:MAG: hypothetical protein U0271_09330 [Polyangiaceae bacterium]
MRPERPEPAPVSVLFVVRRAEDLSRALDDVNELLSRRRATGRREVLLGVLVGVDVDSVVRESARESVALAGSWALCWFEPTLAPAPGPAETRRRVLELVLDGCSSAGDDGPILFLPLRAADERVDEFEAHLEVLERSRPNLKTMKRAIGNDASRGGLVWLS